MEYFIFNSFIKRTALLLINLVHKVFNLQLTEYVKCLTFN